MAEYPFVDGAQYRFHIKGQQKSIAVTTGSNIGVVLNDNDSDKQIWIAIRNEDGEVRLKNLGTGHYLEKDKGDNKIKAESSHPGENQVVRATTFKTGWKLSIRVNGVWEDIGVKSDGKIEWPVLVKATTIIFDIEHIET